MTRAGRDNFQVEPGGGLEERARRCLPATSRARRILLVSAISCATHLPDIRLIQTAQAQGFPPRLQSDLDTVVRMAAPDRRLLLQGSPVSKLLEAEPGKEVAVFGAIWIEAPRRIYAESVIDIENHERGGAFAITK